jgi:hypothetical protein
MMHEKLACIPTSGHTYPPPGNTIPTMKKPAVEQALHFIEQ